MTMTHDPECYSCQGTGTDVLFMTPCTECGPTKVIPYVRGVSANLSAFPQAPFAPTTAEKYPVIERPSDRQIAFIVRLNEELGFTDGGEPFTFDSVKAAVTTKKMASIIIDKLLGQKDVRDAQAKPQPQPQRKLNRYGGRCTKCGAYVEAEAGHLNGGPGSWGVEHVECPAAEVDGLDLTDLPNGRYAVPGGDTRLKVLIRRSETHIWVTDAAVYGERTTYGSQRLGAFYKGKIEDALRVIVADPKAATIAYGKLTNTCGRCGRPLEDEISVAEGIGPICRAKMGW